MRKQFKSREKKKQGTKRLAKLPLLPLIVEGKRLRLRMSSKKDFRKSLLKFKQ